MQNPGATSVSKEEDKWNNWSYTDNKIADAYTEHEETNTLNETEKLYISKFIFRLAGEKTIAMK